MNNCEKCGNPVPEEKAFCPNCGAAMMPERERTTETAEGMGETMYEYTPPSKILQAPMMPADEATTAKAGSKQKPTTPTPKATASSAPSAAPDKSQRQPPTKASAISNTAAKKTSAADDNGKLRLILGASAVIFALTILVVVILYIMGKI